MHKLIRNGLLYASLALTSLAALQPLHAQTTPAVERAQNNSTILPAAVSTPAAVKPAVKAATASAGTPVQPVDNTVLAHRQHEVFGANLFTGAFSNQSPGRFNPDYALMIGDQVQLRLWGGFEYDGILEVDPQGNIFVPHVGPIKVLGVANKDLQKRVEAATKRVFRANVGCYASLAAPQPVRVFVGGFVNRPGLYDGTSMDSLLSYVDRAGGIDLDRGSFLSIVVKRGDLERADVNLYDFMLKGRIPLVQLAEGDVIFVQPRQSTVRVSGLVANANRFEFTSDTRSVADLAKMAKPKPESTHVRVVRNTGEVLNTEYYPLDEADQIVLQNGDGLVFTADKKPGTITVRVEGEHLSPQEYVLPYGARFGELMSRIEFSQHSDENNLQLFRTSIRERQREMLQTALKNLETSVLTARSSTNEESKLRKDEAELMLQWVERARNLEPSGQVIVARAQERDSLLLENGDVIRVPKSDGLILVSGEVVFPNAIAFHPNYTLDDYIKASGGFSQSADTSRVIIAHRDGSFEDTHGKRAIWSSGTSIRPGDQVLVLPKIESKSIEVTRGITQIIYHMAVIAKVAFGL